LYHFEDLKNDISVVFDSAIEFFVDWGCHNDPL
jgi:hypothetical protein